MRDTKFVTVMILLVVLLTCMVWFEATRAGEKVRQKTLEYAHPDCIKVVGQDIKVVCPKDGEVLLVFHRGPGKHGKLLSKAADIETMLKKLDSAYTANEGKK